MNELEAFQQEMKQYLAIGGEKRTLYGKNLYKTYLNQAKEMGLSSLQTQKMLERLVAYISASDGQINRSEYEFCNNALFTVTADEFLEMCRKNMMPNEVNQLREYSRKDFKKFGHKSAFYIIALFIISANNEASVDEQKKVCALFGLI